MSPIMRIPSSRVITIGVVSFALFLVFLSVGSPPSTSVPLQYAPHWNYDHGVSTDDAGNATLGFQHIYTINMPERTDKRDATTLAASLTGIKIQHVAAVSGSTIPNKALPFHQEKRPYSDAQYGVWRTNMNILNDMINNNIASALIVEDDADWDVRIKSQLISFARDSRSLLNLTEPDTTQHSPYGDAWKIVWLGHCATEIPDDRYRATFDPTVPLVHHMKATLPHQLKENFPPHTRVVHIANAPICTYAYGITLAAAREILYELSVRSLDGLWDNALADFCRRRNKGHECVTASPGYFYTHTAAGGAGKASDIRKDMKPVEKSYTMVIRWSTRLNLWKLLKGQTDYEDQYPD